MWPELNLIVLSLPTYYLVISFSCLIGAAWFIRRAEAVALSRVTAIDLTLVVFVAGFVGARLMHVLVEEPEHYRAHPVEILYVWNGGFVFLGGMIAALFAGVSFCQSRGEPFWIWADRASLPAGLGYGLGRLGCFLNGCCYGRECHLPWAIHLHGADRHPTQLYAMILSVLTVAVLVKTETRFCRPGTLTHAWLILFSLGRVIMEVFRDDPRGPGFLSLSVSLWLSLVIAVVTAANWLREPAG